MVVILNLALVHSSSSYITGGWKKTTAYYFKCFCPNDHALSIIALNNEHFIPGINNNANKH